MEATSNESLDYSYDAFDSEESSTLIVMVFASCYVVLTASMIFGVPCNLFVLYRMRKLSRKCSDIYSNGAGRCLFVMAIADIASLCSMCLHFFLELSTGFFNITDYVSEDYLHYVCKTAMFTMHVATFVSIWSWLLMSTLRYMSVYHPLLYIRLWSLPAKVMLTVIFSACSLNAWLLVAVEKSADENGCTVTEMFNSAFITKAMLLIENLGSFVIPCLTIIYVDASVLCRLRLSCMWTSEQYLRRNITPKPKHTTMWRWLVIALVDIGLNAPENLTRLALILGILPYDRSEGFLIFRTLSQMLYYTQFGFNGVYLALFIYDKSTKPRRRRNIESASGDVIVVNSLHLEHKQRESERAALANKITSSEDCDSGIDEDARLGN
ncbi:unnamed protein product [Caenorhabditis auriculariae]|uniref:G-protein coupled receptors family 1 profile domain-containing protein n=1 Tax=Caenorhabditis auriculariae TaxID=2777116 RepID=A0A8S1H5V9_9PELO|nr:unnamed protein product [Caenorhabditis auriculariae]